jgi:DNA polymerase-1
MKTKKKLFLLDGFALIYRAYFAFVKNPRINSNGLETSAILGFTNTLIEVIRKEKPTHIAVVFDRSTPTARHVEYPQYKAHRDAMPDGIKDALPFIDKLLDAFNIPKLYKDGYEADDVIGTLAKKAEKKGFVTFMMTSDKDFAQLVSENIFMYRPGTKWAPTSIWGIPEVLEKFQISRVDQVIDFLGMMGDSADNIPGISGVGEKTAQKFLKQFDSMEGLFDNSHTLKGKIKETVESSKEIGLLCKKLATIILDVPIEFDEETLKHQQLDITKITHLFEELEFKTLLKRIIENNQSFEKPIETTNFNEKNKPSSSQFDLFSEVVSNSKNKHINNKFIFLEDQQLLSELISEIKKIKEFSFHLITNTENPLLTQIVGIAISFRNEEGYYLPFNQSTITICKEIFGDPEIKIIGFDLKFTIKALHRHGIFLKGNLFDVQISHYLLHPDRRHTLRLISENYLSSQIIERTSILGKGKDSQLFSDISRDLVTGYACQHSLNIFMLSKILFNEMTNNNLTDLFGNIEIPLTYVLANMEIEGIALDVSMLKNYSIKLTKDLELITSTIHEMAGENFNISSPKQMGELLFEKMSLSKKPKKTKSGQYSTSEEVLFKLKDTHPIIGNILSHRAIKKLLSTYVDALPNLVNINTNRIHTTFNQSVASTGRLSSVNPNIQNIPIRTDLGMKVREAFIARNTNFTLIAADYSQIELRIMASLSNDKGMLNAFINGIDIHSATAAKVYNVPLEDVDRIMRSNAKSVNFGIIYGISAFGLSQNIGISRKEAQEIIDSYFDQFPQVKEYMNWSINQAREKEYVETVMGRRRYLKDINARNGMIRAMAERNAINAPIQGSAADIIKIAMINISKEIEKREMQSKMLLQVHDELVFDAHVSEVEELTSLIKDKMENAIKLLVPLTVEIGKGSNWLEAH